MKYLIPCLAMAVLFTACKRPKKDVGGKGGNASLRISVMHDTSYMTNGTVYIAYNTHDKPAGNKFDDSAKMRDIAGKPLVTFPGLKKGKYYLYATGYDSLHAEPYKGGKPYTIVPEAAIDLIITTGH